MSEQTVDPRKDPFDLSRFVVAQARVIDTVYAEMRTGHKRTHWMWFIFPQFAGLGRSATAMKFAIASEAEAHAYLAHPILGERLRVCTETVLQVERHSAHEIFGSPDDMKFHSCLTLFATVSGEEVFLRALDKYFRGAPDPATLNLLASADGDLAD